MSLYGVQVNDIENNIISNSKAMEMHLVVGEPIVNILNNNFYKSDELIITGDQKYNVKNVWNLDPDFIDGTYNLSEKSALNNKGTDNLNLGLIIQYVKMSTKIKYYNIFDCLGPGFL